MPKSTFEDAKTRLENAGISTAAFFTAVVYVDEGGLDGLLEGVLDRNEQRLTAAVALHALVEGHAELFYEDHLAPSDAAIAADYAAARSALASVASRLRLNSAERTARAVEKATLLRCREIGELAAFLSEKGVSFRDQAHLLLNPLPGMKHPLRPKNVVDGTKETYEEALYRVTGNLKVAAHRIRKKSATDDAADEALVAAVFPKDEE